MVERHRVLWLELQADDSLIPAGSRVLHFAPERAFEELFSARADLDYRSADLEPGRAMIQADITAIPFDDASFDVVICNHVLEHVPDDAKALSELRRVLRPEGRLVMQHPIDRSRARTYEDWSIVTPQARRTAFLQDDHVRIYGRDFEERVTAAGLSCEVRRPRERMSQAQLERYGLARAHPDDGSDDIWICSRRD